MGRLRLALLALACAGCSGPAGGATDGGATSCATDAGCSYYWSQHCGGGGAGATCYGTCTRCAGGDWACTDHGCSKGGCPVPPADGGPWYTWQQSGDCPFDAGALPF